MGGNRFNFMQPPDGPPGFGSYAFILVLESCKQSVVSAGVPNTAKGLGRCKPDIAAWVIE